MTEDATKHSVQPIADYGLRGVQETVSVVEERIKRLEKAAELQAKEYERRLTELNHAHALAVTTLNTYVTRDLFDKVIADIQLWRGRIDVEMAADRGRKGVYAAIAAGLIAAMSLILAIYNALTKQPVG